MLIDLYNGVERRTGRTAEDTDALRPGDYRLGYALVPVRRDGHILWKKSDSGVRFISGLAPAGESSLAAALTEARAHLGGQVDVSALRLLSHRMDRNEGLIRDVYLVFAADDVPAADADRWLFPEEILGDPALSAGLSREELYQTHRDVLTRLSGEMRVPRGSYVSWQGERVEVLGIAVQSVTCVPLVICQYDSGDRGLWAVPLSRWLQPARGPEGPCPRYSLMTQPGA